MNHLFTFNSKIILVLIFSNLITSSISQNKYKKDSTQLINGKQMIKEKMKIEIWSDIMCPFCYIGKKHFEEAMAKFSHHHNVEVIWRSFLLDPSLPKPSSQLSTYEYLAKRKGISIDQSIALHRNVADMAKKAGLTYNFDIAVVANSFDAHRIIQLAKSKGLGDQAEELFFKAYFCEGKDLCNKNTLITIGQQIGLEINDLNTLLNGDNFKEEVKAEIAEAERIGVQGVPFFLFNRKFAVSGAQPVEVMLEALEKAYLNYENTLPTLNATKQTASSCSPDKDCK